MDTPANPSPEPKPDSSSPLADGRYALPALLREVKQDRASATFAMEKLDQAAINLLFKQHRTRRDANLDK